MFRSSTIFVIGAGASREFSLPTGGELTAQIAKKMDIRFRGFNEIISGDPEIAHALIGHARSIRKDPNEYLKAAWRIRDAMP